MVKYSFDQDMQTLHENIIGILQRAQKTYPFDWTKTAFPRCFLFPYGLPFYTSLLQAIAYLMIQKTRSTDTIHVLFCIPLSLYGVSPFLLPESVETLPIFGQRIPITNPFPQEMSNSLTFSDKWFHYNKFIFPHLLFLRVLFPDIQITPFVFNTEYKTKYLTDTIQGLLDQDTKYFTVFHGNFAYKKSHCTEEQFLTSLLPRIKSYKKFSSSLVDQFSLNTFSQLAKQNDALIEQIMYVTNQNIRSPEEKQKVYSVLGW